MATNPMPEGFHSVNPCLLVEGADRWIDFLKAAFEAEEVDRNVVDGVVRHAEMRIGDSIIELSEGREDFPPMQNALHIYLDDTDVHFKRALAAGATVLYEPADMPYGERSAGVRDPFGNFWFIATYLGGSREERSLNQT